MSDMEKCVQLLNRLPKSQLPNLYALLTAYEKTLLEAQDDAFCEALLREYESDPNKGDTVTFDEAMKELKLQ